jgi:hypothetical protein
MVAQVVLIAFRDLIFDTFIIRNFVRRTPEPGVSGSDVEFVSLNFLRCCVPDKGSGESMMNADFELDGVFVKRQRAKLFEVGSIGVVHTTLGAHDLFFGTEPSWKHVGREIFHSHLEGHAVQIDAQMTCKISYMFAWLNIDIKAVFEVFFQPISSEAQRLCS